MVEIKGIEKFAPKDFPGFISSTVFLGGCNFRCPFCHNADLVLNNNSLPTFPVDFFLNFLESRKDWLEAVCITGGEPLFHKDLEKFIILIKEQGLKVKIDTNGSFPARLERLIKNNLVDFIAMDVKAPLKRYKEVTASNVKEDHIIESIELIKKSGLGYVFRTTVVPGLIGLEDIEGISKILKGTKLFQLQQFSPTNTIDKSYLHKKPYSSSKFDEFVSVAKPYFAEIKVEGV